MESRRDCSKRLIKGVSGEVGCFKYLGSQGAADGGCERDLVHRMNEGYGAWAVLKSVLSNRGRNKGQEVSI